MKTINLDNYSPGFVGFMQATGVAAYIGTLALVASHLDELNDPPVALMITLVLTTFVVSALICGSLVLGYPTILALKGKLARAVKIVAWSAVSLLIYIAAAFAVVLTVQ